jgi:4-hydroxyacetophenone monooxygenase
MERPAMRISATVLEHLIWSHPGSTAYYLNSKRRNFMSWPFRLVDFWWATREPAVDDLLLSR